MNDSDASFGAGGSEQLFQHTYNLWESSAFYNINDLSARNLLAQAKLEHNLGDIDVSKPSTSFWDTEKPESARDSKNRRIVSKESLYVEPVVKEKKETADEEKQEVTNDWTSQFWKTAGEGDRFYNQKGERKMKKNKIQKKLDKALSQPLKIDKAASMMAKMGWEGGALGKTGSGIVEPIAPNAEYASRTSGLGHTEFPDRRRPRKPQIRNDVQKKPKKANREWFNTNVMLQILEFVRNDYEIELMFDSKLKNYERKRIHEFIDDIVYTEDMIAFPCDSEDQMEIALDIRTHNNYILRTVSEGEIPDRSICVYKEPPDHMYLVTHRDLRDEPDDIEDASPQTNDEIIEIVDTNSTESASLGTDDKTEDSNEKPSLNETEDKLDTLQPVEELYVHAKILEKEDLSMDKEDIDTTLETDVEVVLENATETNDGMLKADEEMTKVDDDPTIDAETNKSQNRVFKLNLEGTKHECFMLRNKLSKKKYREKRLERAKANKDRRGNLYGKNNRKTTKFCKVTTKTLAKENNPFLKSILSVQTEAENEPLTKNDLKNQILAYFTEFSKTKSYTQFKFLGAFEGIEIEAINEFISNLWMCINDGDFMSDDILSVMKEAKCGFAIKEDSNGSALIYKTKKEELGT